MKRLFLNYKNYFFSLLIFISVTVLLLTAEGSPKNFYINASDSTQNQYKDTSKKTIILNDAAPMKMMCKEQLSTIGLSTGGAKDIDNFRKNIENKYMPLDAALTYEGLFYDYYFETGGEQECNSLFCPSYSFAFSRDPFSENDEYYLSVGLNSNIKMSDFKRKNLNLIIVLDRSGSMGSAFSKYYYDRYNSDPVESMYGDVSPEKTKIEMSRTVVANLLDKLTDDDNFGLVTFDSYSDVVIPLTSLYSLDMDMAKKKIRAISATNSTNLEAGYKDAMKQFDREAVLDGDFENRIIVVSDEMPNTGVYSDYGLLDLMKKSAKDKIYTTFIGVGVDYNSELVEAITKVRGANYYSVHSNAEFKKRVDDEFEYMVTPLVFGLSMKMESSGFKIEKIYGSPEANQSTGELMKVNTLFASDKKDEQTRGGIIVLKLKKISDDNSIKFSISYEDRAGKKFSDETSTKFPATSDDFYGNNGLRKAILLVRYANLVKTWLGNEKQAVEKPVLLGNKEGEPISFAGHSYRLNRWERQSETLYVPREYKELFSAFKTYFESEMTTIGDTTLQKEADLLGKLSE